MRLRLFRQKIIPRLSIKWQLAIFLVVFAFLLSIEAKNPFLFASALIAVGASIFCDTLIGYFRFQKFFITESSVITGLIIGFVLASDEPWWKLAAAGVLAIVSKYLIRIKKKHLFNPAAFGILFATLVLGASTEWKGTYQWYILLPFGVYFIRKIRKLEVIIGYFTVAVLLLVGQSVLRQQQLPNLFGYISFFFACIMLIEPKTSPLKRAGKIVFGALVAGVSFLIASLGLRVDAELLSLLLLNAAVPLLNLL